MVIIHRWAVSCKRCSAAQIVPPSKLQRPTSGKPLAPMPLAPAIWDVYVYAYVVVGIVIVIVILINNYSIISSEARG
jgi:hypothetical protein